MHRSVDGLSACAHFLLAMIVGRDVDIEVLRQEIMPVAAEFGIEEPSDWIDELQVLLGRELVIRVPAPDGYRYRADTGVTLFGAWMKYRRQEAV